MRQIQGRIVQYGRGGEGRWGVVDGRESRSGVRRGKEAATKAMKEQPRETPITPQARISKSSHGAPRTNHYSKSQPPLFFQQLD